MKTSRCADFAIRVFLPLGLSLMPVGCGGGYPASAKTEVRGEPTPAKAAVEGKKAEVDPEACDPGVEYGGGLGEATLVSIADLMAKPDDYNGKKVRVKGTVTDVCPKAGCWINIAAEDEKDTINFKVKDGAIVFPLSAKGQEAEVEGIVQKMVLDLEQTRSYKAHRAEEKGEAFDPKSVTEGMTLVRLGGTGAVLKDKVEKK